MGAWLIGIGVAGFFVSFGLAAAIETDRRTRDPNAPARVRHRPGRVVIAFAGAALAVLSAWPTWHLGAWLGPYFEVSETTGAAIFACIFGMGGAATTAGVLAHACRYR